MTSAIDNVVDEVNEKSEELKKDEKIIQTNKDGDIGQYKCPKCGATDISLNHNNSKLRCNFCRHEFEAEKAEGVENDIENLKGITIGVGATDIIADAKDILTFKCQSCGAEVVINTSEQTQSRCHWCRNTLSINQQIPNGAVPDMVLPFGITKDVAEAQIQGFVKKRSFFGHPKFKKEFTTENILGVYLPYMVIDINAHATLKGQGEHLVRSYTVGSDEDAETYYDADLYNVERDFDITIDDLTIESNEDKLDHAKEGVTNNIINSIMPFDIENAVKWNANYLKGFSSEKRTVNIDQLKPIMERQAKDVVRFKANETLVYYDRGVRWDEETLTMHGQQWVAAYLPVWLYSYQQKKKNKNLLHYTAVNARTKETMGSIPLNIFRLVMVSLLVEILALFGIVIVDFDAEFILLAGGPAFFAFQYMRYRNTDARHTHEVDTKSKMKNVKTVDDFVKHKKGLSNPVMSGANNKSRH